VKRDEKEKYMKIQNMINRFTNKNQVKELRKMDAVRINEHTEYFLGDCEVLGSN